MRKITITMLAAICLLASCKGGGSKGGATGADTLKIKLTEQRLGSSKYFLSLPDGYSVREMLGEDFMVYYFGKSPNDTLSQQATNTFKGGIYFGNHPSAIDPKDCQMNIEESSALGRSQSWHVSNCGADGFYAHATFRNEKGESWQKFINTFGSAESKQGIDSLLRVCASLREE